MNEQYMIIIESVSGHEYVVSSLVGRVTFVYASKAPNPVHFNIFEAKTYILKNGLTNYRIEKIKE